MGIDLPPPPAAAAEMQPRWTWSSRSSRDRVAVTVLADTTPIQGHARGSRRLMSDDTRRDAAESIPVTVLTGFLGSGKTTLLNGLLAHPDMDETAVLINEFGEIGLDHLLVREISESIIQLNSGCLCCTVRGDLSDSLRELYVMRSRGEVPRFRRTIVETTGLADPAPVIQSLMTDPRDRPTLPA